MIRRGRLLGDRGGQRLRVAVRYVRDVAGQRRERFPLAGLAGQGQRALVRPWKPPSVATMCDHPVSRPIFRRAPSLAPAPELQK